VNGSYTPFLAPGSKFTARPRSSTHHPQRRHCSERPPFTPADVVFPSTLLKKIRRVTGRGLVADSGVLLSGPAGHVHVQVSERPVRPPRSRRLPDLPEHTWSLSRTRLSTPTPSCSAPPLLLSLLVRATHTAVPRDPPSLGRPRTDRPSRVVFPPRQLTAIPTSLPRSAISTGRKYFLLPYVKRHVGQPQPSHDLLVPAGRPIRPVPEPTRRPPEQRAFRQASRLAPRWTVRRSRRRPSTVHEAGQAFLADPADLPAWLFDPQPSEPGPDHAQEPHCRGAAELREGVLPLRAASSSPDGRPCQHDDRAAESFHIHSCFTPTGWAAGHRDERDRRGRVSRSPWTRRSYAQYSDAIQGGTFEPAIGVSAAPAAPTHRLQQRLTQLRGAGQTPTRTTSSGKEPVGRPGPGPPSPRPTVQQRSSMPPDKLEQVMYSTVAGRAASNAAAGACSPTIANFNRLAHLQHPSHFEPTTILLAAHGLDAPVQGLSAAAGFHRRRSRREQGGRELRRRYVAAAQDGAVRHHGRLWPPRAQLPPACGSASSPVDAALGKPRRPSCDH